MSLLRMFTRRHPHKSAVNFCLERLCVVYAHFQEWDCQENVDLLNAYHVSWDAVDSLETERVGGARGACRLPLCGDDARSICFGSIINHMTIKLDRRIFREKNCICIPLLVRLRTP